MSELALEVSNVKKNYGQLEALKGISLSVSAGEVVGVLGPNGAGKTTLISCITTLDKPTSGDIKVFGTSVLESPLITRKHLGVVFQELVNTGFFTVSEIMDFQSGFFGIRKNHERINFILNRLALYEHRNKLVKQLSGGMRRRLMIAKALVHNPKLLLLDEPTAGVDLELRETLWSFVKELRDQGTAVVLTTHYLEEAQAICDRIGVIFRGDLAYIGSTKDVISQYAKKKFVLQTRSGLVQYVGEHRDTLGEVLAKNQILASDLLDVHIEEGNLEEAFRTIVKSRGDL